MCATNTINETLTFNPEYKAEKKFTFKQILDDNWDKLVLDPKKFIQPEQYRAVNKIRACRTNNLRVDNYGCTDCGIEHKIYYNCKHRFCSNCGWTDTLRWAERLCDNMINMPHRHLVITLPHSFNKMVFHNKEILLNMFFKTAAESIKSVMLKAFGVKIGLVSVLHTYGEKKNIHIHVHMIITWGGFFPIKKEIKSLSKDHRVNYVDIKETFRNMFIEKLTELYGTKDFKDGFDNKAAFELFIKEQEEKSWIVHLDDLLDNPAAVVKYIGRYSKRACLSDYKLTDYDGQSVSFLYKDYKESDSTGRPFQRVLKLSTEDFVFRMLQHVPLKNFRMVRYFGIYANRRQIKKEILMKNNEEYIKKKKSDVYEFTETKTCKHCKGKMQYINSEVNNEEFYNDNSDLMYFVNEFNNQKIA